MSTHAFKAGDRIRYEPNHDQTTLGTITARITSPDGDVAYRVKWDDGFKEDSTDDVWANVWVERELVEADA